MFEVEVYGFASLRLGVFALNSVVRDEPHLDRSLAIGKLERMATTTPVSGTAAVGTGTTLDGDGIGSNNDRRRLLGSTKRAAFGGEASTKAAKVVGAIDNLAPLVTIARKLATKGK